jgi:plastocyanin
MKAIRFLLSAGVLLAVALIFSCSTTTDDDGKGNGNQGNSNPSSGSGNNNPSVIPKIKIVNSTGYSGIYIWIKPSISNDWGSRVSSLSDGESKEITLSQLLSVESEYDILLSTTSVLDYVFNASNNTFIKYKVTVSNGMTLTFTNNDLNHGSDLPSITIQNRTGTDFNAIYIKPSSAPDTAWGKSYGSLSNNNNKSSIFIPIPPSNYTEFDIQVKSSNPTNTYTKRNVTISNGNTIKYTYADSDNPLIGQPVIVFENSTGYDMPYIWIKQTNSTDWGSRSSLSVPAGDSRAFTRSQGFSIGSEYDILLSTTSVLDYVFNASNNTFIKYKVTVSESMTLTFTNSDLNDGSDLPSITIQNRTGVSFNSIYVKPSSAPDTDWGENYGSLSNNSSKSVSIPIPLSNYTEFDIQVNSSNPTATYTKRVTVTNGMIVTYTRADSDTPLPGSPVIVIQNNTGYAISYVYIKSSSSETWGSNISPNIPDGESRAYTYQSLSVSNEYDIRLGTNSNINSGNQFVKYSVSVSDGMIVTLTGSDLYTPE